MSPVLYSWPPLVDWRLGHFKRFEVYGGSET